MKRISLTLLSSALVLLALGTVMLFSSTAGQPDLQRFHLHLCWLGLGLGCGAAAALLPYGWLRRAHLPKWTLGLSVLLLGAVFLPGLGVARNGALRWLPFGQPSEFAKLALLIFLADYAASHQDRMQERSAGFLWPGCVAGVVSALVFAEPDWGTAGLLGAVALAMLTLGGAHWGYIVASLVIGAELFGLFLVQNPLRLERVLAFMDPEQYRHGIGWQAWQSLLALGNGGLAGTSFGEGTHKNGFVPEQQTDFVLSLVGEELGFVGTGLVLLLFAGIVLCGARMAWRADEPFGQLLAAGITLLIGLQALINIGVVTSSLPNKGIALPFVSYGGSSLVCLLTGVGLLVSIARHAPLCPGLPPRAASAQGAQNKSAGPVGSLLDNSTQPLPQRSVASMAALAARSPQYAVPLRSAPSLPGPLQKRRLAP